MCVRLEPAVVIWSEVRAVASDDVTALPRLGVDHPGEHAVELPHHHVRMVDSRDRAAKPEHDQERRDAHQQGEHGRRERDGDLLAYRHAHGLYTPNSEIWKAPLPITRNCELFRHISSVIPSVARDLYLVGSSADPSSLRSSG